MSFLYVSRISSKAIESGPPEQPTITASQDSIPQSCVNFITLLNSSVISYQSLPGNSGSHCQTMNHPQDHRAVQPVLPRVCQKKPPVRRRRRTGNPMKPHPWSALSCCTAPVHQALMRILREKESLSEASKPLSCPCRHGGSSTDICMQEKPDCYLCLISFLLRMNLRPKTLIRPSCNSQVCR